MNKNMKSICFEIKDGKNLEANIPQFLNHLVNIYGQYSEVKFAMHYYTFYEYYLESFGDALAEEKVIMKEFNTIIKECLLSDFSGDKMENGVKRLDEMRKNVIRQMKVLTSYTDIFQIYEYVLNRIEYRFAEEQSELNEDAFAEEVLAYIFDTKDNVVINDKIKEVIGQLPVRMSKGRYFDIIKDSLSIYKGAERSSLNDYIYMMETCSMLFEPEGAETAYVEYSDFRKTLEGLDYKKLTKEEYTAYAARLEEVAADINKHVDFYYGLQECINNLYVMLLTAPYAFMEGGYRIESLGREMKFLLLPQDMDKFRIIIRMIHNHFEKEEKQPFDEELEEKISYTEGKQEILAEEFGILEPYFYELEQNHTSLLASLMMGPLFQCISLSQKLLSGSLFIELDKVIDKQLVDEEYLQTVREDYLHRLANMFQKNSQAVNRAVMANTINKVPVFFQTVNDVRDYIKNAMDSCKDLAEKTACVTIIRSFFEN